MASPPRVQCLLPLWRSLSQGCKGALRLVFSQRRLCVLCSRGLLLLSHRGTALTFLAPQGLGTDVSALRPFVHLKSAVLQRNVSSKSIRAALQPWAVTLEAQPGRLTLIPSMMIPACRYVSCQHMSDPCTSACTVQAERVACTNSIAVPRIMHVLCMFAHTHASLDDGLAARRRGAWCTRAATFLAPCDVLHVCRRCG